MPKTFHAPYPFVPAGEVSLHTQAESTWHSLLADLRTARQLLLVENYIFEDGLAGDAIADALCAAAEAGVRVLLHIDSFGSNQMGANLSGRMIQAGVEVQLYNTFRIRPFFGLSPLGFGRTHRRIIVIDGRIAWTGGLAFGDPWWHERKPAPARDVMVRIDGPVAANFQGAFFRLWNNNRAGPNAVPQQAASAKPNQNEARLVPQYSHRPTWFRRCLLHHIHHAEKRVWLATAYFIPPARLRRALLAAVRRGVDVRLLLPGPVLHDHAGVRLASHRYYGALLRGGVTIMEYQPSFQHAKAALFDDDWSLIGSPNLDNWSLRWNHEIAVELRHREINQELADSFSADFRLSESIEPALWAKRPLRERLRERFFGLFDGLL
ncbi:MAG: phosphatidylserine/phosphatidylglycerophosphate/cardiolipin synthase family protein [Planctomycetes bacterium]|jgi:phosphatidylserine/phosphatidylglycerophosphate/cardiolipin synthase-like enzyme|nr:phosphatidylserine/phosphatidylglycerophosphate/cardiolipin synthase family protein [Planctomycetota bacterium]MBT4560500.1 phosphatidylserine/phosphatidylglycerophosphate/cardiolipin synthase family protein [Planctomycetota bacterium]MBT5100570.1 phosphatidylserine/phosphatidylglycerophosphate/cardiolipin synthase family protein [Planctomycetota bacterium]MBT7011681.1 phosphatidylserine/phosphatidylglycerophosphate/cardiolipin synthase family protein [Planctomycetota bacterium]